MDVVFWLGLAARAAYRRALREAAAGEAVYTLVPGEGCCGICATRPPPCRKWLVLVPPPGTPDGCAVAFHGSWGDALATVAYWCNGREQRRLHSAAAVGGGAGAGRPEGPEGAVVR